MFFRSNDKELSVEEIKKQKVVDKKDEFITDMSYQIRNPLNSICGMAEIISKSLKEDCEKDKLLMYAEILSEAANELHSVVDECFSKYERIPDREVEKNIEEDDYAILNRLRVMVVEDSEVNQMVVKELLESYGSIVTICENGKEAVEKFEASITGTFDIILMDIKMPVMDGYEATDRIRHSKHTQAEMIPIVAMTAEVFADDIQMALKSGMNAHLAKPFGIDKLLATIKCIK